MKKVHESHADTMATKNEDNKTPGPKGYHRPTTQGKRGTEGYEAQWRQGKGKSTNAE